jgi:hypothetical protein
LLARIHGHGLAFTDHAGQSNARARRERFNFKQSRATGQSIGETVDDAWKALQEQRYRPIQVLFS